MTGSSHPINRSTSPTLSGRSMFFIVPVSIAPASSSERTTLGSSLEGRVVRMPEIHATRTMSHVEARRRISRKPTTERRSTVG